MLLEIVLKSKEEMWGMVLLPRLSLRLIEQLLTLLIIFILITHLTLLPLLALNAVNYRVLIAIELGCHRPNSQDNQPNSCPLARLDSWHCG